VIAVAAVLLDAGADSNAWGLAFNETSWAAAVRCGQGGKADRPEQARRRRRMVEFLVQRGAKRGEKGSRGEKRGEKGAGVD
jgi:hypothetical protein